MKYIFLAGNIFAFLFGFQAHASVRTVEANERGITPIYLGLGRSTILRFRERPKKVVLGNQNYFNIEFIESDLAIQPTGVVNTNLFVYGESHTYGFSLHVSGTGSADDLVHVTWREPRIEALRSSQGVEVKEISKLVPLGSHFQFRVGKWVHLKSQKIIWYEVQLLLNEKMKPRLRSKEVDVRILDSIGREMKSRFVCLADIIDPFKENGCRIIFPESQGKAVTLKLKFRGKTIQSNL